METIPDLSDSPSAVLPAFPSPVLIRAASLLDDPILCDWAMGYFEHPSRTAQEQQILAALWFSPDQMARFFAAMDQDILFRLLQALPPEHFLPWTHELVTCWQGEALDLCLAAAGTLSRAAPEVAAPMFEQYLDSHAMPRAEVFLSIAIHLQYLSDANQTRLLEKLLITLKAQATAAQQESDEAWENWIQWEEDIHRGMFQAALKQRHAALPMLFHYLLEETINDDDDEAFDDMMIDETLQWMAKQLFGHTSWARLAQARLDALSLVLFKDYATLFEETAPLIGMDQICDLEIFGEAASAAMTLLARHHGRSPAADLCWQLLNGCDIQRHSKAIATLALAALATAFERATLDTQNATLTQLTRLLAQNIESNPYYSALIEQIRPFPRPAIVSAISAEFRLDRDSLGCLTLLRFMGELGWPEFTPLVLDALAQRDDDDDADDDDDWAMEQNRIKYDSAASEALMQITGISNAVLTAWDKLDYRQQLFAAPALGKHDNTDNVAQFLQMRLKTMIKQGQGLWYELTLLTPDVRLTECLKGLLKQHNWRIEHCFYCACRLLNMDHPGLAAMQKSLPSHIQAEHLLLDAGFPSNDDWADELPPAPLLPWQRPAQIVSRAPPPVVTVVNENKVGRNDACPCGSGKKYKKCCMP